MDASKNWPNACAVNNIVDALGDCGAANSVDLSGDISFSAGRSFGDGWDVGIGVSANDGETAKGMFTKEGADYYGAALGYSSDNYAVTLLTLIKIMLHTGGLQLLILRWVPNNKRWC